MKRDTSTKELLSPASAAEALDCSRSTIYQGMKTGQIKFVMIGSDRRIPRSEIERIAAQGMSTKTAA